MTVRLIVRCAPVILALSAAPAYADKVKLTIVSDPAGATVYANQSEQLMGYAPYMLNVRHRARLLQARPVRADTAPHSSMGERREASIDTLQLCGATGKYQQFVLCVLPTCQVAT